MWGEIQRFLAAPVFADDEEKTRAAALLNPLVLSVFGVVLLSALATIFVFAEKLGSGIAVGVIFLILLAAKVSMQRGRVRLAVILFLIGLWTPSNAVFVLSGQRSMIGAANVSMVVIAGLMLGQQAALGVAVGSSLLSLSVVVAEALGSSLPVLFPAPQSAGWVMLSISLAMAVVPLNMALRSLRESLERSRKYAADLEVQQAKTQALVESRELELERRSVYLGATTAIAAEAAAVEHDPQELLERVMQIISDQFGFYHTGLFLLDSSGTWAVLKAASSSGGQRMLERGHRLRVGLRGVGQGIVGLVANQGRYRIAHDVGKDAVFFNNPDLPETRSEIALPLRVHEELIGILDVQSVEAGAFSSDDVSVLQALADQVAVAINNTRLLSQLEASLEAERKLSGEITRQAWQRLSRSESELAFVSDISGVAPFDDWEPLMKRAVQTGEIVSDSGGESAYVLAVPIRVRDQVVGVIDGRKPDGTPWTEGEIDLLQTLTEQLGAALESARLYQNTQRRVVREQILSEITGRMRETLDMDSVMQTALQEMGKALDVAEIKLRMRDFGEA